MGQVSTSRPQKPHAPLRTHLRRLTPSLFTAWAPVFLDVIPRPDWLPPRGGCYSPMGLVVTPLSATWLASAGLHPPPELWHLIGRHAVSPASLAFTPPFTDGSGPSLGRGHQRSAARPTASPPPPQPSLARTLTRGLTGPGTKLRVSCHAQVLSIGTSQRPPFPILFPSHDPLPSPPHGPKVSPGHHDFKGRNIQFGLRPVRTVAPVYPPPPPPLLRCLCGLPGAKACIPHPLAYPTERTR